jgi:hypothetical protein
MRTTPRKPTNETFTAKVKRRFRQFDAWVERQVGKLEPEWRRRLAIGMGVCMTVAVAIGGIAYLVGLEAGTIVGRAQAVAAVHGVARVARDRRSRADRPARLGRHLSHRAL